MSRKTSRQEPYPAEKARGGEIILRKPWQRWMFIAGVTAAVLLALWVVVYFR